MNLSLTLTEDSDRVDIRRYPTLRSVMESGVVAWNREGHIRIVPREVLRNLFAIFDDYGRTKHPSTMPPNARTIYWEQTRPFTGS